MVQPQTQEDHASRRHVPAPGASMNEHDAQLRRSLRLPDLLHLHGERLQCREGEMADVRDLADDLRRLEVERTVGVGIEPASAEHGGGTAVLKLPGTISHALLTGLEPPLERLCHQAALRQSLPTYAQLRIVGAVADDLPNGAAVCYPQSAIQQHPG